MKKVVCLIISVILILSSGITGIAAENGEYEVKTVNVEYSDNVGNIEKLNVIEKEDHVYVSAGKLAQRLGYQCLIGNDSVMIYNKDNNEIPVGFTIFYFDSTKVSHMLFSVLVDDYEAPACCIKDGDNVWIPLEYSLLILGSSMSIVDDTVLIDMPQKSIIDVYYDIMKNHDTYRFEWEKDFGYSDLARDIVGGSSHLINLFNGVLKFDGDSWIELFQSLALDSSSYDSKYGEDLALLICTESDKELKTEKKRITQLQDLLTSDGKIGKILSQYSDFMETEVGAAYETCENILQQVEKGNSSIAQYNRSFQALEKALDKQTWFSNTGQNILDVQSGISDALSVSSTQTILDVGLKVLEVVGYASEFQKQDDFSVSALDTVVSNLDENALTFEKMKKSMADYTEKIQSNVLEYSARRYFDENVDSWIKSSLGVTEALGTQANIELLAWDLASSYIPRLSDSLNASDDFELALYASIFATDAYLDYQNLRNHTFESAENITPENLYKVSQYCYVDLKACYITRDAALGSLKGKSYSTQEELQPLIDQQNKINEEIAEMLVLLKDADKRNDGLVYGFLPSDNEKYLAEYKSEMLIETIKNSDEKVELCEYLDNIDQLYNLVGGTLSPETGDHEQWFIADGIQYGNYVDSTSVDAIALDNRVYRIYNIFVGQSADETTREMLDTGWQNNNSNSSSMDFNKNNMNINCQVDSTTNSISHIQFWRDISEEDIINIDENELNSGMTKEQAIDRAKEKFGDDYSYFCTEEFVYQGKAYYAVDVKTHVENHLTRLTQVLVAKDGSYVGEGLYFNNGTNEQIEFFE